MNRTSPIIKDNIEEIITLKPLIIYLLLNPEAFKVFILARLRNCLQRNLVAMHSVTEGDDNRFVLKVTMVETVN